ncbi:hypothetical protein E2562_013614 [Oryza meyeriana var. granulata]|uniref:Uncharacterized protein n=1 Tax=Oryza meyeriana var. granulata TaxID=110450 RepID=A0A6G1C5S7_9ORYZ|nr:hypothetical protein E2562_013614 [Oryza meyeriana var. granulata]
MPLVEPSNEGEDEACRVAMLHQEATVEDNTRRLEGVLEHMALRHTSSSMTLSMVSGSIMEVKVKDS